MYQKLSPNRVKPRDRLRRRVLAGDGDGAAEQEHSLERRGGWWWNLELGP